MKSCKIITGEKGSGKTSLIRMKIAQDDHALGFVMLHEGEEYFLLETKTGTKTLILTPRPIFEGSYRKWYVNEDLFRHVYEILREDDQSHVYIDEVGMMECFGGGFKESLDLVLSRGQKLTIAVRRQYVENVTEVFHISYAVLEEVKPFQTL